MNLGKNAKAADATEKAHKKAWDTIEALVKKNQAKVLDYADDVQKGMTKSIDKITKEWQEGLAKIDALVKKVFDGPEWRVRADQISNIFSGSFNKAFGDILHNANTVVPDITQTWRNGTETIIESAKEMSKAFSTALGNITSEFAGMLTDSLFETVKWSERLKNLAISTAKSMLNAFLVGLLNPLTERLAKWAGELADVLTDAVTKAAKTAATTAATAAATQAGTQAATTAAGTAASTASGGATQAAGAASSGIAGGLISGGLAAAGSIGVIMQLKRIEGTMNAVEYNTRATEIHSRVMIDHFFHPWNNLFEWMLRHADIQTNTLSMIHEVLSNGGSTGGLNMTVNAYGVNDPMQLAQGLDEILATGRGGFRERWTLIFNQGAGVVSTVPAG